MFHINLFLSSLKRLVSTTNMTCTFYKKQKASRNQEDTFKIYKCYQMKKVLVRGQRRQVYFFMQMTPIRVTLLAIFNIYLKYYKQIQDQHFFQYAKLLFHKGFDCMPLPPSSSDFTLSSNSAAVHLLWRGCGTAKSNHYGLQIFTFTAPSRGIVKSPSHS